MKNVYRCLKPAAALLFLLAATSLSFAQQPGPKSQAQKNFEASVIYHNTLHQQQIYQKNMKERQRGAYYGGYVPGNMGAYPQPYYGRPYYGPPRAPAPGCVAVAP